MRIDATGNVGIGTSNPQAKLDVNGNMLIKTSNQNIIQSGTTQMYQQTIANSKVRIGAYDNTLLYMPFDINDGSLYIAGNGNVGIGISVPQAKLHVDGNINAYAVPRIVTIDLSALSTSVFYPVHFDNIPSSGTYSDNNAIGMFTHYFSIEMQSQVGNNPYNMHSLHAVARCGGWSDQNDKYEVFQNMYQTNEKSILGIYGGTQSFYGIIVYLRGGQPYYIITNSREVRSYTNAVTLGMSPYRSTFALKNETKTDVSGTSANIRELWTDTYYEGKYFSHSVFIKRSYPESDFPLLNVSNGTATSFYASSVNSNGWNGNRAAILIGKDSVTNRSVNAAGTVNVNGADYAEYMTKNSNFVLNKGDICGIDANGLLTNKYSESITFVVKSTDPGNVGGNSWGTPEAIGMEKPDGDSQLLQEYHNRIEMARNKVDRISFCGQVPVNVYNCNVGDYIIVMSGNNDEIIGYPVSQTNLTFQEYQRAIGRIIKILPDGRALIIVKVV
jgi:hypothetical protein